MPAVDYPLDRRTGGLQRHHVLHVALWHAHGLKPHRMNDPQFTEKLKDIVGLYRAPEHALVLCCDEKGQIQALDRAQPGLPLKKGRAATVTHDCKRMAPRRCSLRSTRRKGRSLRTASRSSGTMSGSTSCA